MQTKVTIYTVAERANVSIATVSRIINGQFHGKDATRQRVLEAMKALNFRPSREARRLTGKKTSTGMVGVMAPFFIHPFFVEVLKGAYRAIHGYKHSILLYDVDTRNMKKQMFERIVHEDMLDGLLLVNMQLNENEYNEITTRIPLVIVAGRTDFADSVFVDNYAGIEIGVRHLYELGHRSIAFINNEREIHETRIREKAFKETAEQLGIDFRIDYRSVDRRSGYLGAKTVVEYWPEVTALFFYSDLMAFGGLDYVNENQLLGKVSLLGFDGFDAATQVGMATIVQPMEAMGETGARMLQERLEHRRTDRAEVVLNPWLEKGRTCTSPKR